jgi:AcrR family transcriptional regulator
LGRDLPYAVRVAADVPLIERKQRHARQRIVAAADELFAARGFDAVSVNDIAERAEVGRTTFFRHFGDKQEVVFAREQELLDLIAAERVELPGSGYSTPYAALEAIEPVLLRLLERMTADRDGYLRHLRLIDDHAELAARDAVKMQGVALRLRDLLVAHGCAILVATLAAEIAMACYWTARRTTSDPATLVEATRTAFRQMLDLGARH